ncbi:MAG: hypothetical protein U1E65_29845 [Myxococcota bacterium]
MLRAWFPALLVWASLGIGCDEVRRPTGGSNPSRDGGSSATDAGRDAGNTADDAGFDGGSREDAAGADATGADAGSDGGSIGMDAPPAADATGFPDALDLPDGPVFFDAMDPPDALGAADALPSDLGGAGDGGSAADATAADAGSADAGSSPASQQIAAARALPSGAATAPIDGAIVTWVRAAAIGADVPGFAIQAERLGPALWIEVDPSTLSPIPAVGDVVRFTISMVGSDSTLIRKATAITGYTRIMSGVAIAPLVQDVSGASDLVSNVVGYELELVSASLSLGSSFRAAGSGFVSARAETAGLASDPNLELRLPAVLYAQLGLGLGCSATVQNPLWRFAARAQLQAYSAPELQGLSCPAARLVSVTAVRPDRLVVAFDQPLLSTSVTTSGFSVPGLNILAARAVTNVAILTTSPQIGAFNYGLTVLSTVRDARGGAIDPSFNFLSFSGATQSAVLRVNEVNANINGGCDLVELRAVSGGSVDGWTVRSRDQTLATLSGITVARNDYIIVHVNGGAATCNPNMSPSETSAAQAPAATYSTNYDTAIDVYGTSGGMVATNNVISVVDASGNIRDAVVLSTDATGMTAAASEDAANGAAAVGEWTAPNGTVPVGGFADDGYCAAAVIGLGRTGTDRSGATIQRSDDQDSDTSSGWTSSAPQTWGLNNPGQQNL